MYIVEIYNGDVITPIHFFKEKLESGKIVKGINTIDSFTFSMMPDNPGFRLINEFTTIVKVYNNNVSRTEFVGRVLYAETTMDEDGFIIKTVTCESVAGFLCDSVQKYVYPKNWAPERLLVTLINQHNSQVEEYKRIHIVDQSFLSGKDTVYEGIQRENTWNAIKTKILDKIGGELKIYTDEDNKIYLSVVESIGELKETEIALSVNMKSITQEKDPSAFVTRLIPLGCKLTDENGEETENRLDISAINNGLNYIDDEDAIALYGIHVGIVEWDDVTIAENLLSKGEQWLKDNNKVQIKYSVSALDLSLIGLAVDDFDIGNTHPIKNELLGINDTARIIKQSIDICEEVESTIEVGDNFKTLSDIQRDQAQEVQAAAQIINGLQNSSNSWIKNFTTKLETLDQDINDQSQEFHTEIEQLADSIRLEVTGSLGSKANIVLSAGTNEYTGEFDLSQIRKAFADDPTAISISAGTLTFNSNTIIINSSYFSLDKDGYVRATGGTIGGWTLKNYKLYAGDGSSIKTVAIQAPTESNLYVFAAGGSSHDNYADCPFRVTKAGKLYATDAVIYGDVITIDGSYKTELDRGSLRLYYDDALCGTINTKYWSNASGEGISLRIEEGGHYIMFSHPSDSATGYDVDYYLNYGWSTNYDEKHIFQTSARFLDKVYFSGSGAYFKGIYLYDNNFIRSCASDGTVGEEMLGYSSDRVNVGSVGCPTMLRGTTVYLKNTNTVLTSDRNAKNSIETLPDAYEAFFDALDPVRFKYNEGKSGRFHVGYIAQDVESALFSAGLDTTDFAGYVDIDGNGKELGLAYDEFIAILHKKIKRLESRLAVLENL